MRTTEASDAERLGASRRRGTPLKILVLGATGGTGQHVVEQALGRGHQVTAFVRAPEKLRSHEQLAVRAGDPRDADALAAAVTGHDVLLSALGPRSRHDAELMPACVDSIVAACERARVGRVLLVSSALLFPGTGAVGAFFAWLTRGALEGADRAEARLMRSAPGWTIVRPVRLTHGPLTRSYRFATGELPAKPRPIARADLAHFLLEEIERAEHRDAIVGLCR